MGVNGNGARTPEPADPAHIINVRDFSPETLRTIVAHLEVSTAFEHMVYREAELDAIWSITGFFLAQQPESPEREAVDHLRRGARQAHDLVGEGRAAEAAQVLRSFL
ncbi:MAG: hypothetical protein C5B51_18550 [Terriglobia bacterium]|nr:MAG: hypothetical protein C5B51_18550 [Terriglobia bacterium]